jgi:hypothetical protein
VVLGALTEFELSFWDDQHNINLLNMAKKRKYNNRLKNGRFGAEKTPPNSILLGLPDPAATPQTHDPQRHHESVSNTNTLV